MSNKVIHGNGLITEHDIYLFKEGAHFELYNKLGSHLAVINENPIPSDGTTDSSPNCRPGSSGQKGRVGLSGVHFAVWAPNAEKVSVIGDFNGWNKSSHPLGVRWDESGIWEGFIPHLDKGTIYKYHIVSRHNNYKAEKMDPLAFHCETPPKTASIVWDIDYKWNDQEWMAKRCKHNSLNSPISVYEVHLGSWRRKPEEGDRFLSYREMAPYLVEYVKQMGFTHVEFLPVMEHPFYGSWGYQSLGFFAPTSRYGTPQDFMFLVDSLHQNDIGVILDWVPSHFPSDEHGLTYFDGTHLYEHSDYKQGFHPDWKSYIFNHGRREVKNFLISSALFWLDKYHADGLRVDAVASMLYLDYSRKEGEWIPNEFGGRENLQAIDFIKCLNKTIYGAFPDAMTVAEESTAWPMVTRPTSVGGLGFGLKWNMGWMHDTLQYFSKDPIHRKYHHNDLTFSMWYAFTENFALPLSHDEVVHGKGALIGKMPADDWQKFANLKLLFGYMYTHPGKKLLFMGDEFAQRDEWNHDTSLQWHLLQYPPHQQVKKWVEDLNRLYKSEPALYELDFELAGFEWIDHSDYEQSVISFLRRGSSSKATFLVVCNFTPVPRLFYQVGVPYGGFWKEVLNSDSDIYGGSNHGNFGGLQATEEPCHGRKYSLLVTAPPLGIVVFSHVPTGL